MALRVLYYTYENTIHRHNKRTNATAYSVSIRLLVLTSTTRDVRGLIMKTMKRNRLRQLVSWGYITQPEANQLWRDYLRGVIPVGKIPKIVIWRTRK